MYILARESEGIKFESTSPREDENLPFSFAIRCEESDWKGIYCSRSLGQGCRSKSVSRHTVLASNIIAARSLKDL